MKIILVITGLLLVWSIVTYSQQEKVEEAGATSGTFSHLGTFGFW